MPNEPYAELRKRVDLTLRKRKAQPHNKAAREAHIKAAREYAEKMGAWQAARSRTNKDRKALPPYDGKHRK